MPPDLATDENAIAEIMQARPHGQGWVNRQRQEGRSLPEYDKSRWTSGHEKNAAAKQRAIRIEINVLVAARDRGAKG